MFDIFVKRKRVVIDLYQHVWPSAYKLGKPQRGSKVMPDWWKQTPSNQPHKCPHTGRNLSGSTIKTCPGVIELYGKSIIIPSWTSAEFEVLPNGQVDYITPEDFEFSNPHGNNQFEKFCPPDKAVSVKIRTCWTIQSKPYISVLYTEPTWSDYYKFKRCRVTPGVVDLKYVNAVNINMLAEIPPEGYTNHVRFDPGDHMLQIFPLTDLPYEVNVHMASNEALKDIKWPVPTGRADKDGYEHMPYSKRKKYVDKLIEIDDEWSDK